MGCDLIAFACRYCFLYDDKFLNGDLEVEIPLHFLADSLVLVDTLDFTYSLKSSL